MTIGTLEFTAIAERPDLLSEPTHEYLQTLPANEQDQVYVAEIDPAYAGGDDLCAHYHIDPTTGGNCVILEASRANNKWYVACVVSPGSKIDLNGFVRKHVNARRISLASKQEAIDLSGMEYGSINVVGLPSDWKILIDANLTRQSHVIMGSGLVKSKIAISGKLLLKLPNAEAIEKLGVS